MKSTHDTIKNNLKSISLTNSNIDSQKKQRRKSHQWVSRNALPKRCFTYQKELPQDKFGVDDREMYKKIQVTPFKKFMEKASGTIEVSISK